MDTIVIVNIWDFGIDKRVTFEAESYLFDDNIDSMELDNQESAIVEYIDSNFDESLTYELIEWEILSLPAESDCPLCDGPGVPLGTLGNLNHFTCRNCGIKFNTEL